MLISYILAFLLVFASTMILTPVFVKISSKFDFTDKPTERKKHTRPTPLVGGLVMFAAFSLGFFVFVFATNPVLPSTSFFPNGLVFPSVLFGAFMIVAIGVVDDFYKTRGREFPVWPRLVIKLGVASLAFAAGIRFVGFVNPFTDVYVYLNIWLQYFLTILWFVGLMTAFNFMDGLDGLAGSLALVSGATFVVVALHLNQPNAAMLSMILVAAVAGFLRYNLPPAKVYMGDSGAYLLGYVLAVISLYGAFKQATVISLAIPMLAMGVPIFDGILVVLRRILAKKPAHVADSTHITHLHFRLLKDGMKPGHAVMVIFLLSACLNLVSIIIMLAF